jgi:hypothetical protein
MGEGSVPRPLLDSLLSNNITRNWGADDLQQNFLQNLKTKNIWWWYYIDLNNGVPYFYGVPINAWSSGHGGPFQNFIYKREADGRTIVYMEGDSVYRDQSGYLRGPMQWKDPRDHGFFDKTKAGLNHAMIGAANVDGRFVTGNARLSIDDWLFAVGNKAKANIDIKALTTTFKPQSPGEKRLPSMPPMSAYVMDNVYLLGFEETAGQHSFALSKDGSNRFYGLNLNTERGEVNRLPFDNDFGIKDKEHLYSIEIRNPGGGPKYLNYESDLWWGHRLDFTLGFMEHNWHVRNETDSYWIGNWGNDWLYIPDFVIMDYVGQDNGRPYYHIREAKGNRVFTVYTDFINGYVLEFRNVGDRPPTAGVFQQEWYFNKKD